MGSRSSSPRYSNDNGDLTLEARRLPADTCPLCRTRSLAWADLVCTCGSCGSVFEIDESTRRCRYLAVSPAYTSFGALLLSQWLTRREVFDAVSSSAAAESRSTPPRQPGLTLVWGVLIGALVVIPILCACLSALLLSPGIQNTRSIIALARTPAALAKSPEMISGTQELSNPVLDFSELVSPLPTPTDAPQTEVMPEEPPADATLGAEDAIATEFARSIQQTEQPPQSEEPPTAQPQNTAVPAVTVIILATATQPPTFTPNPSSTPQVTTPSPQPSPTVNGAATAEPSATPSVTPGVTVVPSPTPTVTEVVVVTTVMYTGTPGLNYSDQYAEVVNRTQQQVSVGNWILRSQSTGRAFLFPAGLVMQPGQTCRIYGNSPPPDAACGPLSFNSPTPVWSLIGDTAELRDVGYNLMSQYTYVSGQ